MSDGMTRRRILLVPSLTELEWPIRPLIDEWAEVASYDAPGVGAEPPAEGHLLDASARRGFVELERREWDRCVIVGDEYGAAVAARMAAARPEAVEALVLGHACLYYRREGDRPSLNPEVAKLLLRLAELDFRAFARQMFMGWDPRRGVMGDPVHYDDIADRYLDRVSPGAAHSYLAALIDEQASTEPPLDEKLRQLGAPLLFVKHEGCVLFTPEGFEDAVAAFPGAQTAATPVKPSITPEFADILREFCQAAVGDSSAAARPG
jgi:pimeloyl-ACP methyl ester carboxylesterase